MSSQIAAMFKLTCGACHWHAPDGDYSACPACGGVIEQATWLVDGGFLSY